MAGQPGRRRHRGGLPAGRRSAGRRSRPVNRGGIRGLYDRQEHKFAGPYGDNGFLEDYVAQVHGEPIGCVVLVTRNASGQTQHVVASYRPRSSLLLLSRLLREKFAGTPYGEQFAASDS